MELFVSGESTAQVVQKIAKAMSDDKSNTGQGPHALTKEEKADLRQPIQKPSDEFKRPLGKVDSIFDSSSTFDTEETEEVKKEATKTG